MQPAYDFLQNVNALTKTNFTLVQALSLISHLPGKSKLEANNKRISIDILGNIKKGYSFSIALSLCPYINIENSFIKLLNAAEQAACIPNIIDFICFQHKKNMQIQKDIKNALSYPCLVMSSALIGTGVLIYWKDLYLTTITIESIYGVIFQAITVLIFLLILLSVYVYESLKEPKLFKLYYTLGFLQKSGFTFCKSLELFMGNVGRSVTDSLYVAYTHISNGELISVSFSNVHLADDRIALVLELAEKSGSLGSTCEQIASELMEVYESKKKRCFQLLEPLILFIVGVYIIILINGIIIPFITDFGGIV